MKFHYVHNYLPKAGEQAALQNQHNYSTKKTIGILRYEGTEIAKAQSIYKLEGRTHRIIGIWRSADKVCGLSVTQSLTGSPSIALSLIGMVAHKAGDHRSERYGKCLLCSQAVGPFMIKTALERLEVFEVGDPDMKSKMKAAWRELVDRYSDTQTDDLGRVTSYSYRRGLSHGNC